MAVSRAIPVDNVDRPLPLLAVDKVSIEYKTRERRVRATHQVSFDVHGAERFILLGPSGCGKSTLLKAIAGFIEPTEGRIAIDGKTVQGPGPDRIVVFQEFDQLPPWKTLRQNVAFPLVASRKLNRREADERAMHYLDKVGLAAFADAYPHTLSGGMKGARMSIGHAGSAFIRPEVEYDLPPLPPQAAETPLPWHERLWQHAALRKGVILALLAVVWELAARYTDNDLLLPGAWQTAQAFVEGVTSGELLARAGQSMRVLVQGYLAGVVLAFVLTTLAVSTRFGRDLLSTLTAMFNPLPAIALLPLALLWFGLGEGSLVFVLIHSVLWALALNMYAGFLGVSDTLRMAGRNYGLTGLRYVLQILVPAALPAILAGLKIGWAFAWRTLIAAELVFGASSGKGGLGWYIFQNRNELYTDRVFAGLAAVVIIGLLVENLAFDTLERLTVRRWGMQR